MSNAQPGTFQIVTPPPLPLQARGDSLPATYPPHGPRSPSGSVHAAVPLADEDFTKLRFRAPDVTAMMSGHRDTVIRRLLSRLEGRRPGCLFIVVRRFPLRLVVVSTAVESAWSRTWARRINSSRTMATDRPWAARPAEPAVRQTITIRTVLSSPPRVTSRAR